MDASSSPDDTFRSIADRCGTDKTLYHGYDRFYPTFIEKFRDTDNACMIEIGIQKQLSLGLWLEYFPKMFIHGVDIGVEGSGERYCIHKVDQSNEAQLRALGEEIKAAKKKCMFINDDGSHVPAHGIISFNYLFKEVLEGGGVYIIEDIETSYWKRGNIYGYDIRAGYKHRSSLVEIFKRVADDVNSEYLLEHEKEMQSALASEIPDNVRAMISTITFAQNCIILTKKAAEGHMCDNRPYKWPHLLR